VTKQYLAYDTDETAYGDADDVTGDTVVEQSVVAYDASGNVIQTTAYAVKHTEGGTGELTTSSARVTYTASWYDGANRQTATANYGTNGGSCLAALHGSRGATRCWSRRPSTTRRAWPLRPPIRLGRKAAVSSMMRGVPPNKSATTPTAIRPRAAAMKMSP
jgi:hypothetical protein